MIVSPFIWIIIFIISFACFSQCSIDDFRRLSEYENAKLQTECGIRENDKSKFRISHGERAKQGQFPWAVVVYKKPAAWCTGSIISPYHVLTAAHCFVNDKSGIINVNVSIFRVLGGTVCFPFKSTVYKNGSIDCQSDEPQGWFTGIKQIIIPRESLMFNVNHFDKLHPKNLTLDPKYERITPDEYVSFYETEFENFNDIAVLELQTPLIHGNFSFLPVCIPSPKTKLPENVKSYGYGLTEKFVLDNGTWNSRLYYLDQYNIWSLKNCSKREYKEICDRALFWFPERGNKRTLCKGDSGGGMVGMVGNQSFIFGVTSNTLNFCTHPKSPFYLTVFSRVAFDIDFICYYTGICPNGYNKYMDKNYENHPQPVAYVSDGQGPPIIGPDNLVTPSKSQNIFTTIFLKVSVSVTSVIKKFF